MDELPIEGKAHQVPQRTTLPAVAAVAIAKGKVLEWLGCLTTLYDHLA